MKRFLICLFSCAALYFALPSSAAAGTFEKMLANISAMGAVDMTVSMEGEEAVIKYAGQKYQMMSEDYKVWCDGKTQWIYSVQSREMTVCSYEPESVDLAENPSFILSDRILASYSVAQQSSWTVILKAKPNVRVGYPQVEIDVNSSFLPKTVRAISRDGETFEIEVLSLKKLADPSKVSFSPSESLLKSSVLNDMR